MRFGIRTLMALMLLGGLSVGVFAGSLIARDRAADPATFGAERALELKVDVYRAYYDLDPEATDSLRRVLRTYTRRTRDALNELRGQHADRFEAIRAETEAAIQDLVAGAGARGR
jgi:hypothetical protein